MYEQLEEEHKFICPNCGGDMQPSKNEADETYICKECGCCVHSDEIQDFNSDAVCPNCNQSIEGNECSYCGYDLGSDFE